MSPFESMVLDFEKKWWRAQGAKEEAIRDTFDMTPVTYYRHLAALLDEPEALAAEPILVNRLRRIRDSRKTARSIR